MNPSVILALISDLYNQNALLTDEIERLRRELTEKETVQG